MRIVAGRLKGRTLATPKTGAIRPTADRLREAVFNSIVHAHGDPLAGGRVLDLFAGTGALAIEALSRGAVFAALVDDGAEARGLMRENIQALGLAAIAKVLRRDATKLGAVAPFAPFDVVFCDPPYGKGLAEAAIGSALAGGWLAGEALVVVEESAAASFRFPAGIEELDRRRYDDTEFIFGRKAAGGTP